MRRALKIVLNDGSAPRELEIGRYTQLTRPVERVLLHVDKLPDGKLLLIVGADLVSDLGTVDRIEIIRED